MNKLLIIDDYFMFGCTNFDSAITIPSSVENEGVVYTVDTIGEEAFFGCTFAKVNLPNTITSIGVSPSLTSTAFCIIISPPSGISLTKCPVAPVTFTPFLRAAS